MSAKVSTIEEARARYGTIVDGKWADEGKWCVRIDVPEAIQWINSLTGRRADHIYCNRDMAPVLLRALNNVVVRGLVSELETFDGCFEIRDVRAEPGKPSAHSYALAIDINAAKNKLGQIPTMSAELVACFTDVGFDWGGNFHRLDGMHFSFCWEGKPLSVA